MRTLRIVLLLAALFLPSAVPASAQLLVGVDLLYARASGEFADFVDDGFGLGANVVFPSGPSGMLGLRVDLGWIQYGNTTRRIEFPGTGGLILLDLNTSNNIIYGGVGPEISIPFGGGRLYGSGSIGFARFSTDSHLDGASDDEDFARTTNLADGVFAWTGGGGLQINGPGPTLIDFGVIYHGNGRARYLTEEGISQGSGNNLVLDPIESDTNFLTFRLGVTFPVGG